MSGLLFYLYAGFGLALLFSGLDLLPPLFSGKWWLVIVGLSLLINAFKPENPQ